MYGIPGNLPGVNAPPNVTHGKVIHRGNPALFGTSETFRGVVPEGVNTIWVTFANGGAGSDSSSQSGPSSASYYQQQLSVTPGSEWDVVMGSASNPTGATLGGSFTCCGNVLNLSALSAAPSAGGTGSGTDNKGAAITALPGFASSAVLPAGGNPSYIGQFGAGGSAAGWPGICIVEW